MPYRATFLLGDCCGALCHSGQHSLEVLARKAGYGTAIYRLHKMRCFSPLPSNMSTTYDTVKRYVSSFVVPINGALTESRVKSRSFRQVAFAGVLLSSSIRVRYNNNVLIQAQIISPTPSPPPAQDFPNSRHRHSHPSSHSHTPPSASLAPRSPSSQPRILGPAFCGRMRNQKATAGTRLTHAGPTNDQCVLRGGGYCSGGGFLGGLRGGEVM